MLWGCLAADGIGALHKSQNISQEVKVGCKLVFQIDNDPKHPSRVGLRTTKSRYWSDHHKAQLNPIEHLWAKLKSVFEQEAYKTDSVTPVLSGEISQNSQSYCEKLVES